MRKDIDAILAKKGVDSLLLYSESTQDGNMYYLTRFLAPDPFILFKKINEEPVIIVATYECPRAQKESIVKDVRPYKDYNYLEIVKSAPEPQLGLLKFISAVAKKELGINKKICVLPNFQTIYADALRRDGLNIMPHFDVVEKARETKEPDEINEIKKVQAIIERVTKEAIDVITSADISPNGTLTSRIDGKKEPLTVSKIKGIFGHSFLDSGHILYEEMLVACGPKGANPHYAGDPEDELKANQPIFIDIYPRSTSKRYYTDMTRTIVKGRASKEVKKMFDAVLEAKNASMDAIKSGVLGSEPYNVCCNVLEKAGYPTTRGGKQLTKGFLHTLGHGVGLQVHEEPKMGELSKFPLEEHNILTVEPGLYDPEIGGVRIEDIVEVTKTGCNNLTKMEIVLEV